MEISFWEKTSFYAHRDVIIIGAGLQGLWCAYALKQLRPSLSVLILEKAPVPHGASTRNAGFACFGSPSELLHDAAVMGEAEMLRIAGMRYRGMAKIRQLFADQVIGFDACGGYECLSNSLHRVDEIYQQLGQLNKGLQEVTGQATVFSPAPELLPALGLKGFDGLVFNRLEGGLHSGKLVQALMQLVRSMGVELLTGIAVNGYEPRENHVALSTTAQLRFSATQLISCMNAFTPELFPEAAVQPGRGQILLTHPVEGLKLRGTFHFEEGFYYFRNLGNRILLGGARNLAIEAETTTHISVSAIIQDALESFLARHFITGQPLAIDQRWSGIMGFTPDKKPLITQLYPRVWMVNACNGMGVALSPVIGEQMASATLNQA